jgi:serine/threonine protein kinase
MYVYSHSRYSTSLTRHLSQDLSSEVLLWRQLQHPNILQFLGVNDQDFAPSFAIVTPWMENGSLSSYLERRPFYGMSRKLRLVCFTYLYETYANFGFNRLVRLQKVYATYIDIHPQ